jgi:hypothetical protein
MSPPRANAELAGRDAIDRYWRVLAHGVELLAQLVVPQEAEEVGARLPVLDRVTRPQRARRPIRERRLREIRRRERRRAWRFHEHGVPPGGHPDALGPAHHAPEAPLERGAGRSHLAVVSCGERVERAAEPLDIRLDGLHRRRILEHEAERAEEVKVVVVLLLVVEREHLVRRRREEEHAHSWVGEEISRERGCLILAIEQVAEALELVEDDQVRLERVQACGGEPMA